MLRRCGLRCEEVADAPRVDEAAGVKLLWSCCMWLLCHARGCTVSEVHAAHSAELAALVAELARELPTCHGGGGGGRGGVRSASEVRGLLDRLEAYSLSMPSVVPSKELALAELEHRNLWFRRRGVANGRPQPLHAALLDELGCATC